MLESFPMKTEVVKLSRLKPYKGNPRIIPAEAVAAVADSIREFGQLQPLVVTDALEIIAGHTRAAALKELGLLSAWIVRAKDLTADQVRAYRLADNRTAEKTDWDMEALTREVQDLKVIPGFTEAELESIRGLSYDPPAPEPEKRPKQPLVITCPKCGHEFE